jgi:hypothetical protein
MSKRKTLVKTKIVLEDKGTGLTTYFWKKTFWIFGYWYPYGTACGPDMTPKAKIVNDDNVSKVLFDEFISGHPAKL